MILDGMIAEYRHDKYEDDRLMVKVRSKLTSDFTLESDFKKAGM